MSLKNCFIKDIKARHELVAHVYSLSYLREADIGRIIAEDQPRQKKKKVFSQEKNLGSITHTCHLTNSRKHKLEGSWSRLAWAKRETLSPK
jgi:hypothetical protein